MRIALAFACLFFAFFGPLLVSVVCAVLLATRWRAWEIVMIAVIADVLWMPVATPGNFPLLTSAAIALVWFMEPLRRELLVDRAFE